MSTTDPALSPAAPEPPPRRVFVRKKSGLRKLLTVASILVAGAMIFLCQQYFAFQREKASVEAIATAYLNAVESGNYAAAYKQLAPETQALQSLATYERAQEIFRRTLGAIQSRTNAGWNIFKSTSGGRAEFRYDTKFANGSGVITLGFVDSNGKWIVSGHHIDSPLFVNVLTCPSCEHVQKDFSPYCPACGKANPKLQIDRPSSTTQPDRQLPEAKRNS